MIFLYLWFYSLNRNYIDSGEYVLFESDHDFEIVEFIAANSNNSMVSILYENNDMQPEKFILNQN